MLGIQYLKAPPTSYVMHYRRGKPVREGAGLSFFYFAPFSMIAKVSLASFDTPFVFEEATADFQDATIQGELTYRIQDAARVVSLLDFTVNGRGHYNTDDPEKMHDRLIHAVQILARSFTARRTLAELLISSDELVAEILAKIKQSETVAMLGVEVLGLSIVSIKGTPEITKALQTEAREELLRKADEAVYARRNAAVEQERKIKENELNTEIAVEQKKRTVRETKMEADVVLEEQRAALVDRRVENERKEAQSRSDALRAVLDPMKEVDWRTLMAASQGGVDSKMLIAMAFRDLADNAQKIGKLNISPELLESLVSERDEME